MPLSLIPPSCSRQSGEFGTRSLRHVEFLGVPGSGKSTLARALTTISKTRQPWSLDEATRRALRRLARDRVTRMLARRLGTNAGRLTKAANARTHYRVEAV